MGADYSAVAVIGVPLPDEDSIPRAKTTTRKKAFKHKYEDDGDIEFDPKTGKKLFLDETEETEEDYPAFVFNDENGLEPGQKIIKIPKGLEIAMGTEDSCGCLGIVVETGSSNGGDDYGFMPIPDLDELKAKIKDFLEPLGLWDEKGFGLHVILYCSY